MHIIVWGLLVHLLLLLAAFDIYFSSPVDHGMRAVRSTGSPPAKRLVLFVADGLRAEAIYTGNKTSYAPNLTKIRKTRATWGVSHTRVPTESRPGHVAMLAGIFEDPSAILKGWTANPVDFDSVVNESTNAWCWGSPDIVKMFNKENRAHIHVHTYDAVREDFGNNNTVELDEWVFNKVEQFVAKQMECEDCTEFHQQGNLFFLHLLGIDTAGHGFKPNSQEYMGNLQLVDSYIPRMEQLFETAFPDNSTAYIFTADHGMTDWGSHGAGSGHETETPIIGWGAGIQIDDIQRDINQTDIAPLIAAILGIGIPTNSIGTLPDSYIQTDNDNLATMLISNVLQLYEIFKVKYNRRKTNALHFKAWADLTPAVIDTKLKHLNALKHMQKYNELRNECFKLMHTLKHATNYYHNYYQLPILTAVTVGLVFWILYLATFNVDHYATLYEKRIISRTNWFVFLPLYLVTFLIITYQQLPLMYYLYFLFPFYSMQVITGRYFVVLRTVKAVKSHGFLNAFCSAVAILAGLKLIVQGLRNRESYSIIMYLLGTYVLCSKSMRSCTTRQQKILWISCCFILSWFPRLPVMNTTFNLPCYVAGCIVWRIIIDKLLHVIYQCTHYRYEHLVGLKMQKIAIGLTPFYALAVAFGFIANDSVFKYLAWILFVYPVFLSLCSARYVFVRATSIVMGLAPFYFMVTTNYESTFLILYVLLLYLWMVIESSSLNFNTVLLARFDRVIVANAQQTAEDFRRAFFFVCLVFVAFFGTGNIASVSSFDPMWVRCFLTVFSPFRMSGLILLRICVPFIYLTVFFRGINSFRKGNAINMFVLVMMLSDVMVLELLYSITNIGSWLEIGMSLSHFIIMEAFVVIMLLLYGLVHLWTTKAYTLYFRRAPISD